MKSIEALHKIVETEAKARKIYDETSSLRDSFEEYVGQRIGEMKKEYAQEADKEIEAYRVSEKEKADKEIKALDSKLKIELAAAQKRYVEQKAEFVNKLVELAVNLDA